MIIKLIFTAAILLAAAGKQDATFPQRDTVTNVEELNAAKVEAVRVPTAGMTRMTPYEFKIVPSLLGETDVLKALQLIPGITGGKEGNTGVMIRGGNYDQTGFLLDGGTVFSPAHLQGFVSSYNPETIQSLDIYKGELPAMLGGKLSGVVDISNRNGHFKSYHGGVSLGILSSNAWIEGPIIKERMSFIAGVRKSYFNLIMFPIYQKIADRTSFVDAFDKTGYYDATFRLAYIAGERDSLSFTSYIGNDRMDLGRNRLEATSPDIADQADLGDVKREDNVDSRSFKKWGNIMESLNWQHIFKNGSNFLGTLSYSRFSNDFNSESHIEYFRYAERTEAGNKNPIITELNRGKTDRESLRRNRIFELKSQCLYNIAYSRHNMNFGATLAFQGIDLLVRSDTQMITNDFFPTPVDDSRNYNDQSENNQSLMSLAVFADDHFKLSPYLTIRGGLRGQMWSVAEKSYFCLEPRLALKFSPGEVFCGIIGYNRTSQALHQLTSSVIVSPGDVWVPVTKNIRPMIANHTFVELSSKIPGEKGPLKVSLQGYFKTMDNLLEWTNLSLASNNAEWETNVSKGRGTAYGVEFAAEKKVGKFLTMLAYTWSKSLRQFDDLCGGDAFYASNDRRNDLNILFQYNISRKWDMSAAFSYHTGDRFTLDSYIGLGNMFNFNDPGVHTGFVYYRQDAKYPAVTTIPVNSIERNNYLMKDYHRLDLSLNYHMYHRKAQSTINLSIYNLYNRMNPYTLLHDYDKYDRPAIFNVCIMPFMPSLTYSLHF